MHVLFFGTFDERAHPRVRALREGFERRGHAVSTLNAPLGLSTAARVRMARNPLLVPVLLWRLAGRWLQLWRAGAGRHPEVVVVGYLGHFDVHLARRRFRDAVVVLDHMVSLGDTVRDRGLGPRSIVARVLDGVDRAALRAADVVVVDTSAQAAGLPSGARSVCVVPVSAPDAWLDAGPAAAPVAGEPLRVVFFGLYTPLQGALVIGRALGLLADDEAVEVTMIGAGQDRADAQALASANPRVRWIEWVDADELPAVVASHHVCLGTFGTTPKALRVVPNKVVQGVAAGCAVVTSDTAVQREALGEAARYVAPGSAGELAAALRALADSADEVAALQRRAGQLARGDLSPAATIGALDALLEARRQPMAVAS